VPERSLFAMERGSRRFPEISHQLVAARTMSTDRRASAGSEAPDLADAGALRTVCTQQGKEFAELPGGEMSWRDVARSLGDLCSGMTLSSLPIVQWLPRYSLSFLRADLIAGLSVGVLLIPQSMAYSLLAGLSPIYGLYSSTIPLFVYALLASSTKVSVGPVAPTSILINGIVASVAMENASPEDRAALASALAFATGAVQIGLGLLRFGFIAQLLSWPVMSGYLAGAAITIVASQLKDFFGVTYDPGTQDRLFYERVGNFFANLDRVSGPTTALSAACLVVLVGYKYLPACGLWRPCCVRTCGPRPPRWMPLQLLVVVAALLLAVGIGATATDGRGFEVIGPITRGFPAPSFPIRDGAAFLAMLPQAFVLAVIAYVGTISLAVSFARKDAEEVSANMELFASGAACLAGSFFQGFAVSGSFTRTAVNADIGARTPMAVVFTASLMTVTLLALAPVFEVLPRAALAAMVVASTQSLIKPVEALGFWRHKRLDCFQAVTTLILTLWLGVDWGIIAAVGVALAILVFKSFKPRITELGNLPGTEVFVDRARYPDASLVPGVIVYRVDGELHFGNIKAVSTLLAKTLKAADAAGATQAAVDAAARAAAKAAEADARAPDVPAAELEKVVVSGGDGPGDGAAEPGGAGPAEPDAPAGASDADGTYHYRKPSRGPLPIEAGEEAGAAGAVGGGGTRERLEAERAAMLSGAVLRAVVVDGVRVSGVDLTACRELRDLVASYRSRGVRLLFAALPGPSRDVMERFGVMEEEEDDDDDETVASSADGGEEAAADKGSAGDSGRLRRMRARRFITVSAAVDSAVPRRLWPGAPPAAVGLRGRVPGLRSAFSRAAMADSGVLGGGADGIIAARAAGSPHRGGDQRGSEDDDDDSADSVHLSTGENLRPPSTTPEEAGGSDVPAVVAAAGDGRAAAMAPDLPAISGDLSDGPDPDVA